MIKYINAHDNPLAIYVFSQSTRNRDYIFERTRSGGFVHNDVLVQFMIPGLSVFRLRSRTSVTDLS
jgi:aldehyde dehydrogenase (NAD+)